VEQSTTAMTTTEASVKDCLLGQEKNVRNNFLRKFGAFMAEATREDLLDSNNSGRNLNLHAGEHRLN